MANVTCAISGLPFTTSYFSNLSLAHSRGYYHPIFAARHKDLYSLYSSYTKNQLSPTESYLLYLAFLHSSDKIDWQTPASCNPNSPATIKLIANTFSQLLHAIEQTNAIRNPRFTQPSFRVSLYNSNLDNLPMWIEAWNENLNTFKSGIATDMEYRSLIRVENKLSALILSGEDPAKYAKVIATWAAKAADFPLAVKDKYITIISSCFNPSKMFNTPLAELREVKEFCEANIEAGSIHFHALMQALTGGIHKHTNYLGGSSLALGYTLLDLNTPEGKQIKSAELKTEAELTEIINKAPDKEPIITDYPDKMSYLKAKLAYRSATLKAKGELGL